MAELFLGGVVDPSTHERTGSDLRIETSDLTTHGVIVGMTGSGKTGLGVVLIEEVLAAGVPALLIDPKGDLTNLCLSFPDLDPTDFRPWIDEAQAKEAGQTADEFAAAQAAAWTDGLAGWGYGPDQIRALHDKADFTIYTPGSNAGTALNLVGSLDAPTSNGDEAVDDEAIADQIEGFVTGLLGLLGIDADPLASREHILLSNLIHHAWSAGRSLDLPTLVGQVQTPPIDKLGVISLEEFFGARDRKEFAVKLNGLLASPSFAAWGDGAALDIQSMLFGTDGGARCAIVTTAHLSDEERQFVTSIVLGKLITWMRSQSGTTDLRALLYMDEVAGYLPPTAAPATKKPIMLLMKQARAFGVGVVLSTQNPVDIDYKAISNAGTWMVGRLQTERDKSRLLDGMSAADGAVDVGAVGDVIGALAKREFVLRRAGKNEPEVFTTRWAMSYLRGPMTKDQIRDLRAPESAEPALPAAQAESAPAPAPPPPPAAAETPAAAGTTPVMPQVAEGTAVRWLDPAAAGVAELGGNADGNARAVGVVAEIAVRYDDTKLRVAHDTTYVVGLPVGATAAGDRLDASQVADVPVDLADLLAAATGDEQYRIAGVPLDRAATWKQFERDLVDHVVRTRPLSVSVNEGLKLASEPGESADAFIARCATVAQSLIDADKKKLTDKHAEKSSRLSGQRDAAADRADVVAEQAEERKRGNWLRAAGDVLGGLFGSKRNTAGSIGRAADRLSRGSDDRRVDEARNKVERFEQQQADLDAELQSDLLEVDAKWATVASTVTTASVPAEKSDVKITQLYAVWVPTP